jgi:branched-chain amino acid transport system substrate-binding protein
LTGNLQSWGEESKNSIALAVDQINTAGGINGRPLRVIYEDGKCENAATVAATQKLITIDKVKVILPFCSTEVLTAAPIAEQNHVLLFAPASTSPNVTTAGDYVFRLAPSDALPAKQMADLLGEKYKRIAIITEVSEFSTAFRDNVLQDLKPHPAAQVVFSESFVSGTSDFRSILTKTKGTNPEVVIVNANTAVAEALIIKQMQELGIDVPRYGLYWGSDPQFLSTAKQAADGFYFYNFVANKDDSRVQKFLSDYQKRYGSLPPNPQFATLSYDAPFILSEGMKNVGDEPDAIKNYLYQLKDFSGLSGLVSFDANGDSRGVNFNLFEVKSGVAVKLQ